MKSAVVAAVVALTIALWSCGGDQPAGAQDAGVQVQTQTLAFQDDVAPTASYRGTSDTFLKSDKPAEVHGADPTVQLKSGSTAWTGLLRWDVSAIPTAARVSKVTVELHVTNPGGPFPLYGLRRDWAEGAATWQSPSDGGTWADGGAEGDGDRSELLATVLPSAQGSYSVELGDAGIALVQQWIGGGNDGLELAGELGGVASDLAFRAHEDPMPDNRPRLSVTFSTQTTTEPPPSSSSPGSLYARGCAASGQELSAGAVALLVLLRAFRRKPRA